MIELLESRCLLSATLSGGQLTVVGTNDPDRIVVILTTDGVAAYVNKVQEGLWALRKITHISISGLAGKDVISTDTFQGVHATIMGGGGNDVLQAGTHLTTDIYGGNGADRITGSSHAELLVGGANADTIYGGDGNDTFYGGGGNDRIISSFYNEDIHGGPGVDTVSYEFSVSRVDVSLDDVANDGHVYDRNLCGAGGACLTNPDFDFHEHDNVHSDVENVIGTIFEDALVGSSKNNILIGGGGVDTLTGGGGIDTADNDPSDTREGIQSLL